MRHIIVLMVAIFLAACSPSSLAPAVTDTPVPATASPAPSRPAPSRTPAAATATPSATPAAGEKDVPVSPAAQAAKDTLAQQLGLDASKITLVKVESVQWPDGCLGVPQPGIMCNMLVTPGYRVILQAAGQQYEYHTNLSGDTVVLAGKFLPLTANKVLVWEWTSGGTCSRVEIGGQGAAYGPCAGPLTEGKIDPARAAELTYLQATYMPFSGVTRAGIAAFNGQGQQEATPVEMRSIAEWARLVGLEAQGKRSGVEWGVALTWHQEGGIAGVCHDISVSYTGWATATSCKAAQNKTFTAYRLSADELTTLYGWVDQFKNFEYTQKDPAVADAMASRLIFTGTGEQTPSADQQQAVAQFAAALFTKAAK